MKFLIIGARGLIGEAVARQLAGKTAWDGTYFGRPQDKLLFCDISDVKSLEDVFDKVQPTHVLHGANLAGGVQYCEKNPDDAKKIHFDGTANVGKFCRERNAKLIYISTECVFDGKKENYTEDDAAQPLNVYGQCKLKSEEWIVSNLKSFNIVRTMSVFGWQPETKSPNAVMSLYRSLEKGEKVFVAAYRWCTPTYVNNLAAALVETALSEKNGIYHIVGASYLTRYDWLKKTAEFLKWNASLIVPVQKPLASDVAYPQKIRLETNKFQKDFKIKLCSLEQALPSLKQDFEIL